MLDAFVSIAINKASDFGSQKIFEKGTQLGGELVITKLTNDAIINNIQSQTTNLVVSQVAKKSIEMSTEVVVNNVIKENVNSIALKTAIQIYNSLSNKSIQTGSNSLLNKYLMQKSQQKLFNLISEKSISSLSSKASTQTLSVGSSTITNSVVNQGVNRAASKATSSLITKFSQNVSKMSLYSLATIPIELGVQYAVTKSTNNVEIGEKFGFIAGLGSSAAIGSVAGPIGVGVGAGGYLLGRLLGYGVSTLISKYQTKPVNVPSSYSFIDNLCKSKLEFSINKFRDYKYYFYNTLMQNYIKDYFLPDTIEFIKLTRSLYANKFEFFNLVLQENSQVMLHAEVFTREKGALKMLMSSNIAFIFGSLFPEQFDDSSNNSSNISKLTNSIEEATNTAKLLKIVTTLLKIAVKSMTGASYNEEYEELKSIITEYFKESLQSIIDDFVEDNCITIPNIRNQSTNNENEFENFISSLKELVKTALQEIDHKLNPELASMLALLSFVFSLDDLFNSAKDLMEIALDLFNDVNTVLNDIKDSFFSSQSNS